ncbi:MAG: hypothetical protein PHQ23_00615 [Candidatus Wallbacteria bacterium]|nr:hypothetical protein [Candidatus Wallbacteria bacterium]
MSKTDILIDRYKPYAAGLEPDQAFAAAMAEEFAFHYRNNAVFRRNADSFGIKKITPSLPFKDYPYLFVDLFKSRRMCSVPANAVKLRLSSSGTGGRKSFHYLDSISLNRILRIVPLIFGSHGLVSDEKCNYICFTYDPKVAKEVGTAFSDKLLTGLTKRAAVYYTLKFDQAAGEFRFDEEECAEKFEAFHKTGLPLRVLGFPAYIWKVLSCRKKPFRFPESSAVITGGGWKLHTGAQVPKAEFKRMIAEKLGIDPVRIIDTYGMVEHGIPYIDCECDHFHIPVYSRVLVRDPLTMEIVPPGSDGLLQLMSPYMHSFPAISLLSTDRVQLGEKCACGRKTPWFEVLGRGGVKKHKGCAVTAAELLARMEEKKDA